MKYICGSGFPIPTLFFHPNLNIQVVFGGKRLKLDTFQLLSLLSVLKIKKN